MADGINHQSATKEQKQVSQSASPCTLLFKMTAGREAKAKQTPTPTPGKPQKCQGCGVEFPSRNAMFKHLRDTNAACLSGEDLDHFKKYVKVKDKRVKVLLLFGYLPCEGRIQNGDDASLILLKACQQWQNNADGEPNAQTEVDTKFNRSYGHKQRGLDAIAQDEGSSAVNEVLSTRLLALKGGRTTDQWLDEVQQIIDAEFSDISPVPVRLMGRQDIQQAQKFNAEMDFSHRRVEYVLPVEFLSALPPDMKQRLESISSFSENHKHNLNHTHIPGANHTDEQSRIFLFQLRKMMQSLSTPVIDVDPNDKASVMEKGFNVQKRKSNAKKPSKGKKKARMGKERTKDGEKPELDDPALALPVGEQN